ncbi:signal recognition particle-docking protein FtsY [Pseudohoeflea coraliihabitans]|uniref:Signal recognition particle receptor FtsY n=1 Tax=Pseudohoeflea coraliihabitans TaxID=2860393 RepID=A0ABS6WL83_9HYPH|nr:signal recognition particle-docking protein FtsY [Pseudohoeflea sp. DP4N28-3]MBW3096726.1 signal recognition particle-docking protein FtsY [Pseudohoeflea sp. DP4N28-3]
MAMNFIRKVFSFGKKDGPAASDAPAPAADTNAPQPDQEVTSPQLSDSENATQPPATETPAPDAHFPTEGAMQFTPETLPADDVADDTSPETGEAGKHDDEVRASHFSTPPPMTEQTGGEPPPLPVSSETKPEPEPGAEPAKPEQSEPPKQSEPAEQSESMSAPPRQTVSIGAETAPDQPSPPGTGSEAAAAKPNWWQRLRSGLARSSSQLSNQVTGIFTRRKLDEDTLQDLEDVLIQADLGIETAMRITDTLSAGRYGRDVSSKEVAQVMASEIEKVLAPVARPLELDLSHKPHVILVVGVNGTGKTTTIGKLAAKLAAADLKVTLGAGDTFRAAAIEQLKIWGERTRSEVVSTKLGADAAGLAYEAFEVARKNGSDVLIIDTAGRLQNKAELMDELAKVVRVIGKLDPEAPHTVLQTLDATTGQNAVNQVEIFRNIAGVNGLVMTKLDGTARGGILVAIAAKHKLPVYFIGVGEGIEDLEPFEAKDFASAIVGETE